MSMASKKVPAVIVSGVVCLCLGAAITFLVMESIGRTNKEAAANPAAGDNSAKNAVPNAASAAKGMGGGKGGGKGGGAPGGGKGPNSKVQLVQLVTRLDVLTAKPQKLELTTEQKKQVKELLADLDSKDELTEDEAKAKLEALMKLVEGQKDTLEVVGYRWPNQNGAGGGGPGGGPGGGGTPPPNPFTSGQNAEHLKSLQTTLSK